MNFDPVHAKRLAPPAMISITITSRCNLRCVMCHHSQSRIKKQDVSDLVLEQLHDALQTASAIDLTGLGEPLLSPRFRPILEQFPVNSDSREDEFKISFNCNGTRFTDENIALILACGVRKVRVSIDATEPSLLRAIRGVELETVREGMGRIIEAKRKAGRIFPLIGVQMTLMKANFMDASEMVDFCADLGVDFLDIWSLNEMESEITENWDRSIGDSLGKKGKKFNYEDQKISNMEAERVEALVALFHRRASDRGLPLMTMILGQSYWSEGYPGEDWGSAANIPWREESIRCPLPWQVLRTHYDGELHSCCWTTRPVADLRTGSAEEAWKGEAFQSMRSDLLEGQIPVPCDGAGCPFVLGRTRQDQRRETIRQLDALGHNLFNELVTQEIMRKHVERGSAALDVGANAGAHAALLSMLVGPEGKVHAFEPNPTLLPQLSTLSDNVRVWSVAAGSGLGIREFYVPFNDDEQGSLYRQHHSEREVTSFTTTEVRLDDLPEIFRQKISCVKIDTEGHELQVLEGMKKIIFDHAPVVIYECNTEEINAFWSHFGYTVYFPTIDQAIALPNVVALPPSAREHADMLIDEANVDRLLKEVRRRLALGGERLSDRIS